MSASGRPIGRARTVFFGSGGFAVPVLDALLEAPEVELVAAVSGPDRPAGRHGAPTATPVARHARSVGVRVLTPARVRAPDSVAELAALRPDLGVLADYGQIVPQAILDLPAHGILNLHPSLLPRHRGAAPIPAAILAGDRATGVTLMRMDAGLDSGPIVAVEPVPLDGSEEAPDLELRLAGVAAGLLARSIDGWLDGTLRARPQPDEGVTLTRPLRRDDGRLDPLLPAEVLARQVRAYLPWPGSFVETVAGRLVVWSASAEQGSGAPGTLEGTGDGGLTLATVDGVLRLLEVQLAGRRRISAAEVRRGHPALAGSRVGGPATAASA